MKYAFYTLGCKVNQYETQAMETLLRERGHEPAAEDAEADVVIVNSCAVTAESGRKSRQALRHLMERYPNAKSAVCGCWAQTDPDAAEALGADAVLVGRPFVPAVYGGEAEGAKLLFAKLKAELVDTMTMCGAHTLDEITRDCVRVM